MHYITTVLDDSSSNTPFTSEDFLNKLFPNFWSFLINFLALIVLFVVVYFIAYKPLKKLIRARGDYVEHNLRDSEQAKAINERKAKEADGLIVEAKEQADSIIKKAKGDATIKATEITDQAKLDASARQKEADEAIRQAEIKSKQAIHEEIVNVALDASKQVLERNVTTDDNKRLIKDFIADVDSKKTEEEKHE